MNKENGVGKEEEFEIEIMLIAKARNSKVAKEFGSSCLVCISLFRSR